MADEAPKTEAAPSEEKTEAPLKNAMNVKIYAPFQVYFEGQATSVSAVNATGPFDILPKHHNFICMLLPCTIRVAAAEGIKEIPVHRALMHVKADEVVVFVDV